MSHKTLWAFTLTSAAAFMVTLYDLVVTTAIPVIRRDIHAGIGGLEWTTAGFLSTLVLAFLWHWIATTRQSATVAIASTVLSAGWVGLCLAHLLLLRGIPHDGELATFTVLLAVWAGDIGAFFAGRLIGRHKLAPAVSPGKSSKLMSSTA